MAIRIQDATASAMPSDTTILVKGFAGLTIENDVASGTIQCGGQTVALEFILVHAFVECSSSGCTDDASVLSLFDSTFQSLLNYAKGSMTQDIVNAAGESSVVPQLEQIVVDGDTMALVENFKDPRTDEDPLVYATHLPLKGSCRSLDSTLLLLMLRKKPWPSHSFKPHSDSTRIRRILLSYHGHQYGG